MEASHPSGAWHAPEGRTSGSPSPGSPSPVSPAVTAARAHLAEGRLWKARDVLVDRVAEHHDIVALDLLGQVLHDMGDLPAAGAVWFGTRRQGDDVDASVAAWRDRYDDDFVAMWRSLPRSVRIHPGSRRLEALRERARQASSDVIERGRPDPRSPAHPHTDPASAPHGDASPRDRGEEALSRPPLDGSSQAPDGTVGEPEGGSGGGFDAATLIAWVLAAVFVVCAIIGLVTVLRWIVP
ncbi:hypothetical protein [Nostocoides japonicum]|uniref:hypothetical protein n=1 Tax=Nostocoides japonicum TaxID=99481 RepID=UPI000B082ED0|nr:hypothetical protein [Tetrasphaera japonica]